ncbi:MAG TPA: hypothetical protein VMV98_04585 [Acidobacteriaceae bacterium]|nr:hypothetical protein [Acidobacteriaceae bacterium]
MERQAATSGSSRVLALNPGATPVKRVSLYLAGCEAGHTLDTAFLSDPVPCGLERPLQFKLEVNRGSGWAKDIKSNP